jgi:CBS-domain-containing membrane protein
VSVHADAKIGEVLIPLAYSGVHRVWVMDAKKAPVGVVSMSDVIDKVCKSANL